MLRAPARFPASPAHQVTTHLRHNLLARPGERAIFAVMPLACSTLGQWISRVIGRTAVRADPVPTEPDQWIAEEQWAAGLPAHACDRLGWVWWRGPDSAMAQSPSPW